MNAPSKKAGFSASNQRIGFMQGRLSSQIGGKIQAFPAKEWRDEFSRAEVISLCLMEWTLDQNNLYSNPLMTINGRAEILALSLRHSVLIPSVTGDCFMQAPFFKASGAIKEDLLKDLIEIIKACGVLGKCMLVYPLVDNSHIDNGQQEASLLAGLNKISYCLREHKVKLIFESDLSPEELARFIQQLDPELFGINYDIGNSASLGYNHLEEISAYGSRIDNVHVKDRVLGGTTVPLGEGNADIPGVIEALETIGYEGNYILQTARSAAGKHSEVIDAYRNLVLHNLETLA